MKNPPRGNGYPCECLTRAAVFPQALRGFRTALLRGSRTAMLAGAVALAASPGAWAQGVAVRARVTDRVDLSRLTTLAGNTHRLAQPQYDQGAAPADLPMNRMLLVLKRGPEQEAALQDLLNQQQITSSASFHKWLTPEQFGQQFGLADADLQAVTSWLASFGFQSIRVAKGRNLIEFSGTAGQVQAGLHTSIHRYLVNGEFHWANSSDPQVPAALATVISGVASLHDFRPKPTLARINRNVPGTVRTNGARPQISLCAVSQTPCPPADVVHALVPADFNTIYNVGPIASTINGSGVTIGIIADTNIHVQDVIDFRNMWGLPSNNPTVVVNGPDPGDVPGSADEGEAILDTTWSGAVAPQATIKLVVSEDTNATSGIDLSEFYIIDNNLADIMTESFSSCESQFGTQLSGFATMYFGLAQQAAAQGITYAVSSGDGGPDSCDDPSSTPATPTPASVNILASTPFNVAVGGTMFNEGANASIYWSANNGTDGLSALSYIPEDAWNEACTTLSATCQVVGIWSSGGGASAAFAKPVWQAGVAGIPAADHRYLPDVSMAAAGHDGYVICIDGSCEMSTPQFGVASGTSASVQVFGGVMALVDQKIGGRVGLANYALYKLAAQQPPTTPLNSSNCDGSASPSPAMLSGCVFNDVTIGATNIPGETGFNAGVGYDQTTGLGSVNVSNLVNNWHTAITEGTTTTLTLNNGTAVNVTHGTSVPVGIMVAPVAPATGTPSGDVSLIASSMNGEGVDAFTLTNGSVNSTGNSTNVLPGGSYQVHAHYEGDGTFLGSDSTPAISVTVTPEASKISFGIVVVTNITCSTPSTVVYGSPYVLTVDVSSVPPASTPCAPNEQRPTPTGTVTLMDSFNGGTAGPLDGGTFQLNSAGYFEDQPIQLAAGTHAISASYGGDNSFNASGPVSSTITVNKAATTATASGPTTVAANTAFTLMVKIDTQTSANPPAGSNGAAPTGTVTFTATTVAIVVNPERRRVGPQGLLVGEISIALAGMLLLAVARKRRGRIVFGSCLAMMVLAAVSCGSGNSGSGGGSTTIPLGTANLTATTDANGFAEATASLSTAKLPSSATITAAYAGDANYTSSMSQAISVTVQ